MDNGESRFFKNDAERDQSYEELRNLLGLLKPTDVTPFVAEEVTLSEEKRKALEKTVIHPAPKNIM